ncbi:replication-relaxation family protein [Kibdelosporangium aridum]|uniref:replication-relaxation family protein n=1 Tax=Kibdelosporangium aridum TaxID=2030 RepID=UPI0035EBAF44
MLFEHKVLTTHQIIDLAFPSRRSANQRLLNLYSWRVVHRFQPYLTTGSSPHALRSGQHRCHHPRRRRRHRSQRAELQP